MLRALAICLCLSAVAPAWGQSAGNMGLMDALTGKAVPVTLQLKDLTADWRCIGIAKPAAPASGGAGGLGGLLSGLFGGEAQTTYFTRGQTIRQGERLYLIAYHIPPKPLDMAALIKAGEESESTEKPDAILNTLTEKRTPETQLSLALLDVGTMGSVNGVRPFDLNRVMGETSMESSPLIMAAILFPIFAQAREKARDVSSLSNLKQIGLGIAMYSQDWDEILPPMKNESVMKKAIMPYVKSEDVFLDPHNKQPYEVNPKASRKKLAAIRDPTAFILVYEAVPEKDKTRAVLFLDGHAKRFQEADWPRVKRAGGVP